MIFCLPQKLKKRNTFKLVEINGGAVLLFQMSDHIEVAHSDGYFLDKSTVAAKFLSLQYSLYLCCFICIIGGGFFLTTAIFIQEDRAKTDKAIKGQYSCHDNFIATSFHTFYT